MCLPCRMKRGWESLHRMRYWICASLAWGIDEAMVEVDILELGVCWLCSRTSRLSKGISDWGKFITRNGRHE